MQIKRINLESIKKEEVNFRPITFDDFIGQDEIKKLLSTAIDSAKKRKSSLGHILFSGPSGYGKTTLANIISYALGSNLKIITGYAITKPSEIISILNSLQPYDILFIDEIHRLRPNVEEVLYIAMEDYAIDMVLPEGGNVRIPLNPFTLIGATTKLENLSLPLKNRFVYKFHFVDYTQEQKIQIIKRYLKIHNISYDENILKSISENVVSTPREINNFCIKIRDYLICRKENDLKLDKHTWETFKSWADLQTGGLNNIQKTYLEILKEFNGPVGLKTIALRLGLNEKAVEEDVEPLLLKLGLIEKTSRGRVLKT